MLSNKHKYLEVPDLNVDLGVGFLDRNFLYIIQRSRQM